MPSEKRAEPQWQSWRRETNLRASITKSVTVAVSVVSHWQGKWLTILWNNKYNFHVPWLTYHHVILIYSSLLPPMKNISSLKWNEYYIFSDWTKQTYCSREDVASAHRLKEDRSNLTTRIWLERPYHRLVRLYRFFSHAPDLPKNVPPRIEDWHLS